MHNSSQQVANAFHAPGVLMLRIARAVSVSALLSFGAAHAEKGPFTIQQLSPTTFAAIGTPEPGRINANAGFVIGDNGVLVIDSLGSESAAKVLLKEIQKRTRLPIRFLVNTHYHLDHVGGNEVFRKEGATIVAQRGVRPRLPENIKFFGANPAHETRATIDSLPPPELLFDEGLTIHLGQLEVQLQRMLGHTGSDTVVIVPSARIAFMGDLAWKETVPNLVDANVPCWIRTLQQVRTKGGLQVDNVVPGHGAPAPTSDISELEAYLSSLTKVVADLKAQGVNGEALSDAAVDLLGPKYGHWRYSNFFARANVQRVAMGHAEQTNAPAVCPISSADGSTSGALIGGKVSKAPTTGPLAVTPSGTSITATGTAADADGNLASVQVELDGSTSLSTVAPDAHGNWTFTTSGLSNGSHTLRARAVDSSGLQSAWSAPQTFNIGSTPPPSDCSNSDVNQTTLNGISTWLSSNTNYFDSVLVMHCDTILFETYRNGFTANTLHELQSATKTFSSTLVGIMLRKGLITSLDQKISQLLPKAYSSLFTGQKADITVGHLLTMTSGLAWTDFGTDNSFDQINAAADSVQFVLSQKLITTPGQTFFYNTGSSHLLSAIVHYKSGKTTTQFAEAELFGPLGITSYTWPTLKDGVAQGGWGMYMKPRDFIKLAKLYRDGGTYDGVQILDKGYVDAAVVRQVPTKYQNESYGLQMWIEEDFGATLPEVVAGARGWGGQDALVALAYGFAVAFNGSIEQPGVMAKHTKELFKRFIIPSHQGASHKRAQ